MAANKPNYPIGSVDNALRLLLLFRDRTTVRVTDAANELGVATSTAHRLLAMLVSYDLVTQDPQTKAYSAGVQLLALGLAGVHKYDLRSHMRPYLERLVNEVGETTQLVVLNRGDSFFLDSCESSQVVRTGSRTGVAFPAYASSAGKALLADLTREELRGIYPDEKLEPMSPSTVTSRSTLEAELEEVRRRGYALNIGQTDEEVGAIAAVVRNPRYSSPCAVAISAPLARTNRESLVAMADPLLSICREASDG